MKISKLFHWLYAAVMMLPLFLFPIFALAVRSDNNFTPIEVQQENIEVVNFNQQIQNGNFVDNTGWSFNSTYNISNNVITLNDNLNHTIYLTCDIAPINVNNIYYFHFDFNFSTFGSNLNGIGIRYPSFNQDLYYSLTGGSAGVNYSFDKRVSFSSIEISTAFRVQLWKNDSTDTGTVVNISNVQVFNLTQMFGIGNEPSIEQFNIWYSNDYYAYDTGTKQLLKTGTYETFNDADVGSQMIYTAYRVVDNYFNYDNVFNFKDLYTWLEITYFSGTAPMGFFIFWHLLIYWLLTSLLWLLFDVLMYVPMLIHRWLDKAALS